MDTESKNILIDLNFFENRPMRFGKHKGKSLKWVYENDLNYAKWMTINMKETKGDYKKFIQYVRVNNKIDIPKKINYIFKKENVENKEEEEEEEDADAEEF